MYRTLLIVIGMGALTLNSTVFADTKITRGQMIGVTCAGCHGTDGAGGTAIPALKGRDADSMLTALLDYKTDKRPGSIMPRIAKGYTDDELKEVAEYFAGMKD